jgi:hypothetical protein
MIQLLGRYSRHAGGGQRQAGQVDETDGVARDGRRSKMGSGLDWIGLGHYSLFFPEPSDWQNQVQVPGRTRTRRGTRGRGESRSRWRLRNRQAVLDTSQTLHQTLHHHQCTTNSTTTAPRHCRSMVLLDDCSVRRPATGSAASGTPTGSGPRLARSLATAAAECRSNPTPASSLLWPSVQHWHLVLTSMVTRLRPLIGIQGW